MYEIKIQTPYNIHYIKELSNEDVVNFEIELTNFLMDDKMAIFTIEVPEGKLFLPYEILMQTEITIY